MKIGKIRQAIPWLMVLAGFVFITFSPCLKNSFVQWDEDQYLLENPLIRDFSPSGLVRIFEPDGRGIYIPLTLASYSLEYHFFQLNPLIYHLDNLILHLLNVLLVFGLIYLLTTNLQVAFITAALFGVSPLRVESVAWVMERKDVLYSFFYLGALITYIRFIRNRSFVYWGGTLFLFFCSLLAKPQAISFPLMMLAIDYYYQRPLSKPMILEKLPFGLVSVLFLIFTMAGIQHLTQLTQDSRLCFSGGYILVLFFIKSFIPYHLSFFNLISRQTPLFFSWTVYAAMGIVLAAGWLIAKQYSKDKGLIFSFLFYVIALALPILNMRYSDGFIYEHYTYLASIGLYFLFASQFILWSDGLHSKKAKQGALLLLGIYLLVFASMSFVRCGIWKNGITLWSDVIQNGNKTKTISPPYAEAFSNRGLLYYNQGNLTQAFTDYNKAIEIDPHDALAYNNRGWAYYNLGQVPQAFSDYNKALALDPYIEKAYLNRGWAYYNQGNIDLAISDYDNVIRIDPNNNALAYLDRGLAHYHQGKLSEAIADYDKAIAIDPHYAWAYNDRATVYYNQGKMSQALDDYNKAIEIAPDFAMAYRNRRKVICLMTKC